MAPINQQIVGSIPTRPTKKIKVLRRNTFLLKAMILYTSLILRVQVVTVDQMRLYIAIFISCAGYLYKLIKNILFNYFEMLSKL